MKSESTKSTHRRLGIINKTAFFLAGLFQIFRKLIYKGAKTHRKCNEIGKTYLTGSL